MVELCFLFELIGLDLVDLVLSVKETDFQYFLIQLTDLMHGPYHLLHLEYGIINILLSNGLKVEKIQLLPELADCPYYIQIQIQFRLFKLDIIWLKQFQVDYLILSLLQISIKL